MDRLYYIAMPTVVNIEPCNPSRKISECSCYMLEELQAIAAHLRMKGFSVQDSVDKKQLWININAIMQSEGCLKDWCWLKSKLLRDMPNKLKSRDIFRPEAPADWVLHVPKKHSKQSKYTWLSNFDIDDVMAQYEDHRSLRNFKFFRCASIDFEKTKDPLSRVNIYKLLEAGITQIGVVFNLDKHNEPGSHWVSLYCNLDTRIICFFDSYGRIPEPEIKDFIAKVVVQGLLGYDGRTCDPSRSFELTPIYNNVRHQRSGSECGLYSLFMIISMLLSKQRTQNDFEHICKNPFDDETMNSFRRRLFIDGGR